ncbi:MAG: hypothetical protein QG597_679 [Actinomycetota bacterium]|nr:hypothetical protein [Actinomycetota bacterium]
MEHGRLGRRVRRRRWPLVVIGGSAGTATWSGWVGLGSLTGFGLVHPLPGIWDGLVINTAITLPIGVEAYAVYALAVATEPCPLPARSRRYAWVSAAAALAVGMAGQITYHLLAAAGVTEAPWWVVTAVSCLPVAVLGAASLLWHFAATSGDATTSTSSDEPGSSVGSSRPSSSASSLGSSRRDRRADDETLRALVAQARAERPGAGEPTVRRLLAEAGLAASAARLRAALAAPTEDAPAQSKSAEPKVPSVRS